MADTLIIIYWQVDTAYGVHCDCKGHNDAMMSVGKGAILSFSRKQKLNTASSTKAELVGIADALGIILWTKYFMEAQGYTIYANILFKDNTLAILLAIHDRYNPGLPYNIQSIK